jgi:CheY-like chemotaxis protein
MCFFKRRESITQVEIPSRIFEILIFHENAVLVDHACSRTEPRLFWIAARLMLKIVPQGETRFAPRHPLIMQNHTKRSANMSAWKTQTNFNKLRTVLVISQDSKMAAAWDLVFKQKGCYVIHEKTPRHALQAARLLSPALVIVDLDLTQPERLSLCQEIRPMTSCALLLLAPKVKNNEVAEYSLAGVDEHLSPTISPAALLSKSLAWLG